MSLSVQEAIAAKTEEALEDFLVTIRRMPLEKLTWRPLDQGRTALDQMQECATAPLFYLAVIQGTEYDNLRETRKRWDAGECETRARAATHDLVAAIRSIPNEELKTEIDVPKNGVMTILDVLWMHLGNLTYHLGAVNFIQTLYGDLEMD
jgi:hypothetical protein